MKDSQTHSKSYVQIKLSLTGIHRYPVSRTFTYSFITQEVASVKVTECGASLWTHSAASQQREGYVMYRAPLIKYAEYLLTLQWRLLWSTVKAAVSHTVGADVPCCSKDTLQKQCWSSACWRGALAATEGKRQKKKKTTSSNHYLGSDVSVSSDNNPCFNAHFKKVYSRLSDTLKHFKRFYVEL